MSKIFAALLAVAVASTVFVSGCNAQTAKDKGVRDRSFDERIHAYLVAHPEVIEEAIEALQARQDAEKSVTSAAVINKNRQALFHDPRDAVEGNPAGSVTIVEFFDFRCPFCKAAAPDLKKLLDAHHEVRLVLKQFPILDVEDKSHISEDAARAAIGALAQGKYVPVHDALLSLQHLDSPAIKQVLSDNGVDFTQDAAVAQSKATTDDLSETHKLAREIGIDGTPAFVVGEKLIAGANLQDIEAALTSTRSSAAGG